MIATRKLRRARVLIAGCGDVGLRCAPLLTQRAAAPRVIALTSQPARAAELRAAGTTPLLGNLDERRSLRRLAGLASTVLHLAPPQKSGSDDLRTRALIAALSRPRRSVARMATAALGRQRAWRGWFRATFKRRAGATKRASIVPDRVSGAVVRRLPIRVVYASTSGVYGDCGGARIDETRRVRPDNGRAKRRVSAEMQLRRATRRGAMSASIVRIPGIYAANRLPLARLQKGTPALAAADDVFTNHIHADDLAAIMVLAIRRARPQRVIHASDDSELRMGDYFDRIADAYGLPRAPRVSREDAEAQLEPMMLSFMRESRRLKNTRLRDELRYTLRYPSIDDFLSGVMSGITTGITSEPATSRAK
ncbi:NAD-dependent epimerase/dehydratase [Caballeronia sordidicola]|uniref:NAD-dependent epimerase/dehydratase n=1 Tax=Caballeronia sordidicola TaxID=196367 RepID=A0A158GY13_CABSO|nr:NAD-dependent epimerase/dehydratase family protein [Caballeronia sordidicola]SAL36489.1 NAD-dependent epimerase/dehydratase [Caballeronia sordidicola]